MLLRSVLFVSASAFGEEAARVQGAAINAPPLAGAKTSSGSSRLDSG